MQFINNTIMGKTKGSSIFLYSAIPCKDVYDNYSLTIEDGLRCIGNIIIDDDNISTYASTFSNKEEGSSIELIPGKESILNINPFDDTESEVSLPVYRVESGDEDIVVDPAYIITANKKIKLLGKPKSEGMLVLNLLSHEDSSLSVHVILQDCPPGFYYNENEKSCSFSERRYLGITGFSEKLYRANLVRGYWAGYSPSGEVSEGHFYTSNCPLGYCHSLSDSNKFELPLRGEELNSMICGENRTGVICGECEKGTSVHYHTDGSFVCGSEDSCSLGILYFIISDLLPATIIFLMIIFLNVQLTTGALNGFLFYMQVFSTLNITANNFIHFPTEAKALLKGLDSIARMFNLNFFTGLKFCLYKGTNSLDLIAFSYIIIVYSLLLIIITVICLNRRCNKCIEKLEGVRSSTHGLSGFLVLCYAKTTILTLLILTPGILHGVGSRQKLVVFYQGNIGFFHKEHLKYAIPALFAAIFMTCLLPLLLLIYPLCYKVLKVLRLEESKFSRLLCRAVPLEKFKPFFDSFQGAFKDKHRYFASLYFFYRLFILLSFAVTSNLTDFYYLMELQLVVMIVLHGWIQPYKQQWHNMLDMYIFAILVTIIGISSYNYQVTIDQLDHSRTVRVLTIIQVLLAYSPVVFMLMYALYKLCQTKIVKNFLQKLRKKEDENEFKLTLSMLDQRRDPEEVDYQKIE